MDSKAVEKFILRTGEKLSRKGLKYTPKRVEKAWEFFVSGYKTSLKNVINDAIYDSENNNMIFVKDIDFFSFCEHHLLPFFGKMHIAYIPKNKIIGLSKIPRIVEVYARRLQVQERLTNEIAQAIYKTVKPFGVAVISEATHTCMAMRGVQKVNSKTIASCVLGQFKKDARTRNEFLQILNIK